MGAWFSVDAELVLDLAPAAASDDLRATLDYGVIAARIVEVSTKERVNLLERLAGRLAQMLLAEFPCDEVRVRVRKLTPPMEGGPTAVDTGIILSTSDIDADHATLKAAGVDVDAEVARWGAPVPPMFRLRDPAGNALTMVEPLE